MNKEQDKFHPDLVSLVIPMYNAQETIERCLLSIRKQIYSTLQVIIVDDYSQDSSVAKVSSFVKDDPRFEIVQQKSNQGASTARNAGIDRARGQYLFFLDADDWIEPDAIASLVGLAKNSDCDFVCANHFQDLNGECRKKQAGNFTEDMIFDNDNLLEYIKKYLHLPYQYTLFVHCWGKLFNLELIRTQGIYFNQTLIQFEDVNFNYQYLSCCSKVAYKHAYIYHHTISSTAHSLGSRMGAEDQYVEKVLIAYSSIQKFIEKRDHRGIIELDKAMAHLFITTLVISIIRLCQSIGSRTLTDVYVDISKIVLSSHTSRRLPFYFPEKDDSLLIFLALKTKKPVLVLLSGFIRVGSLFFARQIKALRGGIS